MQDVRLYGVLSDKIDLVWQEIEPLLDKTLAFSYGKYNIKEIYNCLKNKDMQLWLAYDNTGLLSFGITRIIVNEDCKILQLPFIGGKEMYKWLHFFEDFKNWAKAQGCTYIEGVGRPGWRRALKKMGFKEKHIVFRAAL